MNSYSYDEEKDKWEAELVATKDRIARRFIQQKIITIVAGKLARQGLLILVTGG